jgi:hypothetical protein
LTDEIGDHSPVTKAFGVLLLLAAAASGSVGLLWAIFKTIGNEWDFCRGGECTSGYVGAATFIGFGAIAGFVGFRLLRGQRNRSRSG